jgi:hypothetical protein
MKNNIMFISDDVDVMNTTLVPVITGESPSPTDYVAIKILVDGDYLFNENCTLEEFNIVHYITDGFKQININKLKIIVDTHLGIDKYKNALSYIIERQLTDFTFVINVKDERTKINIY